MSIICFDHVGITVADLEAATTFFVKLGLEVEGRTVVEGDFIDTVCGIPGSRCEVVMLQVPGSRTKLELTSYLSHPNLPGEPEALANTVGLRNVCLEVTDLRTTAAELAEDGYGLVGGIGEYEGAVLMAYVRGPEGIVVSLAQQLG